MIRGRRLRGARIRHAAGAALLLVWWGAVARGQEAVGESVVVRADRLPAATGAPFAVEEVTAEELRRAPQLRLDDLLRAQVPGFSLFRRSSSRVANPTTQGVTLANFGPSGAGRTLVLLDGIPLNDPFAGYVLWNQAPPASLESVLVTPGGGAGLFGNAALAGTIFLESRRAKEDGVLVEGTVGNQDTYGVSLARILCASRLRFRSSASISRPAAIPSCRRINGAASTPTPARSRICSSCGSEFALDAETSLQLQLRGFREERGNGTLFTRNDTRGADASAVLTKRVPQLNAELRVTAYGQRRKYRSTFSSVNAARDVETPALDQFDVPAIAAGGSAVWSMVVAPHVITLGADVRWVEGETREAFRFLGNDFTRIRQGRWRAAVCRLLRGRQLATHARGEDPRQRSAGSVAAVRCLADRARAGAAERSHCELYSRIATATR
jgi:hypothetical protein